MNDRRPLLVLSRAKGTADHRPATDHGQTMDDGRRTTDDHCYALLAALLLALATGLIRGAPVALGSMDQANATLVLPRLHAAPGSQATVPLVLQIATGQVYSVDIMVQYDPTVVTAVDVRRGGAVPDWSLAANLQTSGEIRVALAGAHPAPRIGELAVLTFQVVGAEGSATALTLTRGDLNEGGVPTTLQNGRLVISSSPCHDYVDPPGVGVTDIQLVVALWRQSVSPPYDSGDDGVITVADIMHVAAAWGDVCL